jgi:hypothetical protein
MSKTSPNISPKTRGVSKMRKGAIISKKENKASAHATSEAPEQKKRELSAESPELDYIASAPCRGYKISSTP